MKATELRIGNWVEIQGIESKIILVDTEGCVCENEYCEDFENNNITQNLQPIPLTEEWLERFGFCAQENYFVLVLGYDFGEVKIYNLPNGFFFIEGVIYQSIESVHQLQNLCFALTESELKQNEDE